jgi:nicotinamide mononucleotide adenylyltransferase
MADICEYGIVCLERTGSDPSSIVLNHDILYKYRVRIRTSYSLSQSFTLAFREQNNIMLVRQWIVNEISSTKIRLALKRNLSIKYLTPDSVVDYIEKEGLYKS